MNLAYGLKRLLWAYVYIYIYGDFHCANAATGVETCMALLLQ